MRFSLVLVTIGRVRELERFLSSLAGQHYPDLELIVVDQNSDDRLSPLLTPYKDYLPILHLRSGRGLNRGRNEGLRHITGDILTLPDDDCWYPSDLLWDVAEWFRTHSFDGLCMISRDAAGKPSNKHWDHHAGLINVRNVWHRAISYTIFLRKSVVDQIGRFDEAIGAGAGTPWISGDETDYLIRALRAGFRIYYEPALRVLHPQAYSDDRSPPSGEPYGWGMGLGRLLRRYEYPFHFALYMWIRSLGGTLVSLLQFNTLQARRHWAMLRGRIRGWLS